MTKRVRMGSPVVHTLFSSLVLVALLAACAPAAAPSPTAAPAKPAAAAAPARPAAAPPTAQATAAAAAKPAATAAVPGVPADWDKQWNDLQAAAKKEGKLVVQGPPNPDTRTALSEAFKKRFGIDMEYTGASGSQIVSRLQSERAAGVHSTDAVLTGADTMMRGLAADGKVTDGVMGTLALLRPALILPEALDPSKYIGGKIWFTDPQDKYILRISNYLEPAGTVNTAHVSADALTDLKDLLKPEYKGKISAHDPSTPGRGLALASFLYAIAGGDYVKQLYLGQEVFLVREQRQLSDLLAKGSHPIALSIEAQEQVRLEKEGFKLAEMTKLPIYTNAGFGLLGLVDKAPHPNAAKLFVNWMASKEGAQVFQEAQRHVSVRSDLDTSSFPTYVIPRPGTQYFDSYDWSFVLGKRAESLEFVRDMLSRR